MVDIGYGIGGWRGTQQYRIRQTWFRTTVERLWEYRDGRKEWRRFYGSIFHCANCGREQ